MTSGDEGLGGLGVGTVRDALLSPAREHEHKFRRRGEILCRRFRQQTAHHLIAYVDVELTQNHGGVVLPF